MSHERQEEIQQLLERLHIHRETLAHYLRQQAQMGSAFTPPGVVHGIAEARENIRIIKHTLRDWKVAVDDHPDDELITFQAKVFAKEQIRHFTTLSIVLVLISGIGIIIAISYNILFYHTPTGLSSTPTEVMPLVITPNSINPALKMATEPPTIIPYVDDSKLNLVDIRFIETDVLPTLDIKVRNTGTKVAFLKRAQFIIKEQHTLAIFCEQSATNVSGNYDVDLKVDGTGPYTITTNISQSVKPDDTDRFTFTLGQKIADDCGATIYAVDLSLIYDEDNKILHTQNVLFTKSRAVYSVIDNINTFKHLYTDKGPFKESELVEEKRQILEALNKFNQMDGIKNEALAELIQKMPLSLEGTPLPTLEPIISQTVTSFTPEPISQSVIQTATSAAAQYIATQTVLAATAKIVQPSATNTPTPIKP